MEFNSNKAIFLQIAEYLSEQILLEKWNEGEKIPSVREVAAALEVNPNTAMRAFETLQQSGIISNKRGIGFFVERQAKAIIRQRRKQVFMDDELPSIFRTLQLTGIRWEDIQARYEQFIKENNDQLE
ncbi:GntR family transcriptional regulator [Parapedobacter sp. DT-150]|uniref:GntR family transcriptional regulator n=1 Tax=Parapedobacter sp. DT-150 TaxID=3396162 RepID=UPI003F1945D5